MALVPKLSSAGLADINSNSAYEKLKFIEEHYEELMQAYQDIMEHLKLVDTDTGPGGECLWEDNESVTFIPYYVTFSGMNKSVCDFITVSLDEYDSDRLPLYWVSGTTYAICIPYKNYIYHLEDYGCINSLEHLTFNLYGATIILDGKTYFTGLSKLNLYSFSTGGCNGEDTRYNHLYVDLQLHGGGEIREGYNTNSGSYEEILYAGQNQVSFDLISMELDLTPFTFTSIKPVNNKQIILKVAE